jgi:hypothetical protein
MIVYHFTRAIDAKNPIVCQKEQFFTAVPGDMSKVS